MHRRLLICVLSLGIQGCGDGTDPPNSQPGISVRDSSGVSIIDNRTVTETVVEATPGVRIGVVDGPVEYQFFRVSDIKRLSSGAIVVANGGSRDVRIYEADGTHRATAGGPGQGPSEFRYPAGLVILPGDTIQVHDFMDRVYFAPDGRFLRRQTADRAALESVWSAVGGFSEGGEWVANGTLLAPVYRPETGPPLPGPPFRPQMTIVRVSADLSAIDTLGQFGGIHQQYVEGGGSRPVFPIVPPFAYNTSWATGSADGTIVIGDNAVPQIHRFHPDGTHSIIRWPASAEAISDAEIQEWKDEQRAADWAQSRLPELERGWSVMDIPSHKAFYGSVAAGSDGTMWVSSMWELTDTASWMMFAREGTVVGTLAVPGAFTPFDSGPGWVVGVLRGANDVEYVQVFDLTP